jgi:hypothetical protein
MAVKYPQLVNEELLNFLVGIGLSKDDIYNQSSDLYIGCNSQEQAEKIIKWGNSPAIYSRFVPQKGSSMDKYVIAVDIAFGYMDGEFKERYGNRKRISDGT